MGARKPDWVAIQADYVRGGMLPQAIASKHHVSVASVAKRVSRGGWTAQRAEFEDEINQRITEELRVRMDREGVRAEAERLERLLAIGAKLADKIEAATDELGKYYEVKRKVTVAESPSEGGEKPSFVEETSTEARRGKGAIKARDVKALASALRDLREVIQAPARESEDGETYSIRFGDPETEEASK